MMLKKVYGSEYNYLRFMECKEQLTRFIYKRLINRFINANFMNDYHFLYSGFEVQTTESVR